MPVAAFTPDPGVGMYPAIDVSTDGLLEPPMGTEVPGGLPVAKQVAQAAPAAHAYATAAVDAAPEVVPVLPSPTATIDSIDATIDTTVRVRHEASALETAADGVKPFRVYTFDLDALSTTHRLVVRFSGLQAALTPVDVDGAFPKGALSFLSDYVHNEANVARRASQLSAFISSVLNQRDDGRLLASSTMLAALSVTQGSPFASALAIIASERRRQREAERAAEAARRAAIAKQHADDANFAQTFNSATAYSGVPPGALTTITFPRELEFELRNRFWGWGDATIMGPGGHPWFLMLRSNPSLFGELFKNAHFTICTMSREPLLVLQENFRWMHYEYDLLRIDPRTAQHVPVCRIVRRWTPFRFSDHYAVQHFNNVGLHGPVECSGTWLNHFTLTAGGVVAASVSKQLLSMTDTYRVRVGANVDVLLFVGIACAIDRIHHEVEDARNRERDRRM